MVACAYKYGNTQYASYKREREGKKEKKREYDALEIVIYSLKCCFEVRFIYFNLAQYGIHLTFINYDLLFLEYCKIKSL